MSEPKRYMITSALPYANGPIHIGHLAGAYLPADIYARYMRLKGKDVAFVCGSDEHGVPVTLRAKKEGIKPQQVVDKYHTINKKAFEDFGISFDMYHRTSDPLHHETASAFFKHLYDKGVFVEKESKQYYDEQEKQFLADRYIVGTCPKCGNENAYGDQCEKCGSTLSPEELKNPRSALSGNQPIKKKTKHWYLPLDKIQEEWLEEWIDSHKPKGNKQETEEWKTNVYGQCKSWLDQGLQPRAVTRDLNWGVPVPIDGADGKVLYVWFDAPIGYISATKALEGSEFRVHNSEFSWKDYWQNKDTKLLHFIGKDNIVFHCLIFPAMLKAHGDYILPENIPSNEFMNLEGDKISTSRNWAVWLHEYLEDFPNKEDVLRYCLISNMPENKDSEFTWKDFQEKNNSELVGILANFINRVVVLTHKYFDGVVPEGYEFNETLRLKIEQSTNVIDKHISSYQFRAALQEFMNIAREGNKYLTDAEPWKLEKGDPKIPQVLFDCIQVCGVLQKCMEIFLPFTSKKLATILKIEEPQLQNVAPGTQLGKPEHLFTRIEDKDIQKQIDKLQNSKKQNMEANSSIVNPQSEITFDDFMKMNIKVGTIKSAEKHPDADKLLKLEVDLGSETRTIVSGIAQHYQPENIVGTQVSVLTNLAPRKIRGIESQGMILMAENTDGKLAFVSPDKTVDSGSEIR